MVRPEIGPIGLIDVPEEPMMDNPPVAYDDKTENIDKKRRLSTGKRQREFCGCIACRNNQDRKRHDWVIAIENTPS
ncbi:hypothetical protein [uncultured Methanoregula sp.]|uniref:hypothetical protein n=1 Tax=uncultured Methanoregula sp. TaxID=1005933 RepID=UPI002AAAEE4D|nr:hypothetical protein [uncultured Methanoregula sp.]